MICAQMYITYMPSFSISLFSCSSYRLCIGLCGSSDNWELHWLLGAQRSRTSMLPHSGAAMQWHFMTASYAICACVWLHSVAATATS